MFGNFFTNLRPSSSSAACLSGHGHQPVTVPSLTASVSEKGGICILFRIRHLGPAMPCLTPVFNICEFCPCLFFLRIFAFRSTAARLLRRSEGHCKPLGDHSSHKEPPTLSVFWFYYYQGMYPAEVATSFKFQHIMPNFAWYWICPSCQAEPFSLQYIMYTVFIYIYINSLKKKHKKNWIQ